MSDLQRMLERFAGAGEQRGADAVFDAAVTTVAHRRKQRRFRVATATLVALAIAVGGAVVIGRSRNHEQVEVVTTPTSMPTTTLPAAVSASLLAGGHWETLPPAPIVARQSPSVVWTGKEMLVWGGASGARQDILHADGAAYDPRSRTWRRLPAAPLTARQYPATVWTGTEVLVRGDMRDCFICQGPGPLPEVTSSYQPATNTWSPLPNDVLAPGPSGGDNLVSVWTGAALWSFNPNESTSGAVFKLAPGDTSVYDPTARHWTLLKPAPYACTNISKPFWTGHEILIYCPSANASGLSYLAPTTGAESPTPPVITSTGPADPVLINALAAELPASYHVHSSDSSIDQTGHHFEEAIFTDQLSSVARASVFDISPPGASFEQMLTTVAATPSGTPGVYVQKNNNFGSAVIAKLTRHRALIVSSSISLAHYETTHPLSTAFLVHAAADLAAKP